jgi:N-acetylglutamate synthase-like GNAT family acetyltransferase
MSLAFTIADLRQCPEFFDTVADRIWQAWWKPHGHPLAYISSRLQENMEPGPVPLALVAHEDGCFLGTASLIASDLAERPQLTPWVAAVWVEPHARLRGVGAALVNHAAQACFALGIGRVYLCARPERADFYQRLGWTRIERDVGPVHLDVFIRDAERVAGELSRSPP